MSQRNIGETDSQQRIYLDEVEVRSYHSGTSCPASNDSNESVWSTQGCIIEVKSSSTPMWDDNTPTALVPPHRRNSQIRLLLQMWDIDVQELRDALDVEQEVPISAVVIGRDHPASSPAALAGYRYRTL
ncbi:hypothetical protein KR059_009704 [Drosophila kikkawai]|nr:hypothetical protein KR059_009704 [Drosophila kikkawai]